MKLRVDHKAVTYCIYIKTETSQWWFGVFVGWNKGEEAFLLMEEIWKQHLNRAKNQLDVELHTTTKSKLLSPRLYSNQDSKIVEMKRETIDKDGVSRRDSLLAQDNNLLDGCSNSSKRLLNEQKTHDYKQLFRLPSSEQLIEGYPIQCGYYRRDYTCEGKLYLSNNFICFHSLEEPSNDLVIFVIPFHIVLNVEKRNTLFGIVGNRFAIIVKSSPSNKEFLFSLSNRDKRFDDIWQSWTNCKKKNITQLIVDNSTLLNISYERLSFLKHGDSKKIWGKMLKDPKLFSPRYLMEQVRFAKLWQRYLALNGSGVTMLRTNDFPELCKRGIPDLFRGKVWMYGSGAMFKAASNPFYYKNLLNQSKDENTQAMDDIEKDLHRSFPEHPYFQNENGINSLRNVLVAYSFHNPIIGYCQSMNIVCALLLLYLDEEDCFWLLCTICDDILPNYYNRAMIGSSVDVHVLELLLKKYQPEIYNHLTNINFPTSLVCQPWLLCLFIGHVPLQQNLRILDCIFCIGKQAIFQACLGMFHICSNEILNGNRLEEIFNLWKERYSS